MGGDSPIALCVWPIGNSPAHSSGHCRSGRVSSALPALPCQPESFRTCASDRKRESLGHHSNCSAYGSRDDSGQPCFAIFDRHGLACHCDERDRGSPVFLHSRAVSIRKTSCRASGRTRLQLARHRNRIYITSKRRPLRMALSALCRLLLNGQTSSLLGRSACIVSLRNSNTTRLFHIAQLAERTP